MQSKSYKSSVISYKLRSGFSVVEALLAASVFGLLVMGMMGSIIFGTESAAVGGNRSRGIFLAEEGIEAVKNIRDADFSNLAAGSYGLSISGNQWVLSGTSDTQDIFSRTIQISDIDSFRKDVTSTVTWKDTETRTGSISLMTRFTDWLRAVAGGWGNPIQQASLDLAGAVDGLKVQVAGNYAYVIRNDSSPDFLIIDISNPAVPAVSGSLTLSGSPTNIFISGDFAYVSSRNDSQELQIINISNSTSPTFVGSFDALGSGDALGVYAVGTTVYLTRTSGLENEFFIINAAVAAAPVSVGSADLGAGGNEVFVSGNYAYIASTNNSAELQVMDISLPAAPVIVGVYDATGDIDALSIALSNNIFLGRGSDIQIISVANPALPSMVGTFTASGTVNDIALNMGPGNYLFLATASSTREFEVVDISNPTSPVSVGFADLTGLNGIAYHSTLDRVFTVGESDTAEFIILAPQ